MRQRRPARFHRFALDLLIVLLIASVLKIEARGTGSVNDEEPDTTDNNKDEKESGNHEDSENDSSRSQSSQSHERSSHAHPRSSDSRHGNHRSGSSSSSSISSGSGSSERRDHPGVPPGDIAENCIEYIQDCTNTVFRQAMEIYCKGTCENLGNDGRDVGTNCYQLVELCNNQYYGENMQKYCRGTCVTGQGGQLGLGAMMPTWQQNGYRGFPPQSPQTHPGLNIPW